MDYYQTLRNDYIRREMYPQVGVVVARGNSSATILVVFGFSHEIRLERNLFFAIGSDAGGLDTERTTDWNIED